MKEDKKKKVKKVLFDWSVIASVSMSLLYFAIWFLPDMLDIYIKVNAEWLKAYSAEVYQHLITAVFFLRSLQSYFNFTSINRQKKINLRKKPTASTRKKVVIKKEKEAENGQD